MSDTMDAKDAKEMADYIADNIPISVCEKLLKHSEIDLGTYICGSVFLFWDDGTTPNEGATIENDRNIVKKLTSYVYHRVVERIKTECAVEDEDGSKWKIDD